MKSSRVLLIASAVAVSVPLISVAQAPAKGKAQGGAKLSKQAQRGEYLVRIAGCHDCHTPLAMGPQGPAPDMSRALSGHPEGMQLPPQPAASGPWIGAFLGTNTAWSGPWGISYVANITSDKETGIGGWTEQQFIQSARTGKHLGQGRPILPPMPWQNLGAMTDEDIKAVFAYLKATPAIKNKVPEPTPPAGGAGGPPGGAGGPPGGVPAGNLPAGGPPGGPKK
jgi:cytochrome c553